MIGDSVGMQLDAEMSNSSYLTVFFFGRSLPNKLYFSVELDGGSRSSVQFGCSKQYFDLVLLL